MLAIRRFVPGSLTLADTGEQRFPLLCGFAAYFFVTCRGVEATLILVPRWVSGMGRQT